MATKNDGLAAAVGQDKVHKDGSCAAAAGEGYYKGAPVDQSRARGNKAQSKSTVKPY